MESVAAKLMALYTPHQLKYMAWELSRRKSSASDDKFTSVLSEAKVDLNPHQVEAALFAFRSPLSKGAVLADEVGLGKTIEAALVISQNWAEKKRHILIIAPATIRKQWSIELEEKFCIPSIILERRNFNKILSDTYSNPFDTEGAIVICSYPFARKNILHIARVDWNLVVLDEAHALCNVYCRTTEKIDRAFDELQSELKQDIEENLQQTRNSLFENFDEEVIEKLRIREDEDLKRLDAFNKTLWELTIGVLGSRAKVSAKERYSLYLEQSPVRGIEPGIYSLDKENLFGNNYRISHPLAKWVIAQGLKEHTPTSVIVFEYTKSKRNIATIKRYLCQEGWLKLRVVRYSSLHEVEEQIVIVALDSNGNQLDKAFVTRLLSLPAHLSGVPTEPVPDALDDALSAKQAELNETLEARNSELVSEEIVKIENWAEDNRKSLQQQLNDLDKEIDEKNDAFVKERNLRTKLAIQKEKDSLMERRDAAWKEYDEQRSTLKKKKNALISQLYELAESRTSVADEFTIKWKIE